METTTGLSVHCFSFTTKGFGGLEAQGFSSNLHFLFLLFDVDAFGAFLGKFSLVSISICLRMASKSCKTGMEAPEDFPEFELVVSILAVVEFLLLLASFSPEG